ncbi:MAG TPA: HAD-IA family hydrolase [Gemmataceae bacterium]|nr:HAD-IA family hydrolase [Gemmataceae bacterium]
MLQTEKRIGERIRAVVFDAVGTLLHPEPSAAIVYTEVGHLFGSGLDVATVRRLFREAFGRQEQIDRVAGWRTSETRELERWRAIVAEVLHDVADKEACFAALFEHFSQPSNWRCEAAAKGLFATLRQRGIEVAMASNFDRRLRSVAAGIEAMVDLQKFVISSEIGWRKPAPQFFAAVCSAVEAAPQNVLIVGDDLVNDYQGAMAAGCHAVLFAPDGNKPDYVRCCHNLENIVDLLECGRA